MKKVFLVFAVAALFVACNDSAVSTPETTVEKAVESVVTTPDTAVKAVVDTAVKAIVDTTKK